MMDANDEKPPLFKKWSGWYWLVMGVLFIQIIVYIAITNSF